MDFAVGVVLPGAGCGERMGLPVPKQFCKVLGRPLISYTIEAFERISWISDIAVVTSPSKKKELEEILKVYSHSSRVYVADGASVRHRSIYNGLLKLAKVPNGPPEVVVIHDAVRPFIEEDIVKKVVEAAKSNGSAGAIRPLISTVIATDSNGFLDHSLDRTKYKASEMPQAFQYEVIKSAYDKCTDYDFDYGTECLHLVDKYVGIKARLIEGPDSLWKVTLRKDLYAAEGMLRDRESNNRVQLCGFKKGTNIASSLTEELVKHQFEICYEEDNQTTKTTTHKILYFESSTGLNESQLLDSTNASSIIAVVKSKDCMTEFSGAYQNVSSIATKLPKCTVNAVLFQESESSNFPAVSELTVSLLTKRNSSLSGQVFIR